MLSKCCCCCYWPVAKLCLTLCDSIDCSTPGFPVLHHLPEFVQTHIYWVSDTIQPPHPLSPLSSPVLNPSQDHVFSSESALHIRWPKYWSLSFSMSPSSDYSGLISFRIDWLISLQSKGLSSLLQHHSSKASILRCSAFLMVQLSLPCLTTGKTIALTIPSFVSKVMSLLFHMLSRFVIAFHPRSKGVIISQLQSHPWWFWSPRK